MRLLIAIFLPWLLFFTIGRPIAGIICLILQVTLIGWLVTEKVITTKKGEPMEFLTLEDRTALYDAAVFPDVYRRVCHLLATNHAYIVTGRVEEQFSTVTLTVKELQLLTSRYEESPIEASETIST